MTDNSFSAIRISLASPEQIRSWSYGEVTKPETINYRNQKPEKDGLFDERIFGPTKDFECYCGKYKRIRYRGVICDRCGVEVTRARVRRERMGHINLAAPVAHIWFAKGTPSWLGLLLDMSPRNLERVLYYAQYVVTEVNEEEKARLLETFDRDEELLIETIRTQSEAAIAEIKARVEQEQESLRLQKEDVRKDAAAREETRKREMQEQAAAVSSRLSELVGQKATESINVLGRSIVRKNTIITDKHVAAVDAALSELLDAAVNEPDTEGPNDRTREAQEQAAAVRSDLSELVGQKATESTSVFGRLIVRKNTIIRDKHVAAVDTALSEHLDEAVDEPDTEGATDPKREAQEQADSVRSHLSELVGQKATESTNVFGRLIVRKNTIITDKHVAAVSTALSELLDEAVNQMDAEGASNLTELVEEETRNNQVAAQETVTIHKDVDERIKEARKTWNERRGELEELSPRHTLTENRYRELQDSYSDVFRAGMGAESLVEILGGMDMAALGEELRVEAASSSGQRAKKAAKRLRVIEGFRKSANKPEWMILTVLPVLPPDLRPMVQLDGGRFATSDLNDLYRRAINRNNRLKRLMELGAPEIIVRNEKRMLQEAVDALIDNGRRGRALTGSHNHTLKSLSDMLRGKQGRFRQNLLGKRVDYSGRSVIVVGSTLKLHQCGLPKRMALELFKPFVMNRLVSDGMAPNIKSAKRMVDRVRPEVWDLLEDVIKERPVFLNRAPTLHRLGIQAFEPVLVEGSAIQIHPLVCAAYNADFDGDQMAVHVPIGRRAVEEARKLMISTHNMLLPSSGEPIVAPTLDIVVGIYYLTTPMPGTLGEGQGFVTYDDAKLAHDLGQVDLRAEVRIREGEAISADGNTRLNLLPRLVMREDGLTDIVAPNLQEAMPEGWTLAPMTTTVGCILFNQVLPTAVPYRNEIVDKKALKEVVTECYRHEDNDSTALILDALKKLGFHYATESGLTIALNDVNVPKEKAGLLEGAEVKVQDVQRNFQRGLLSDDEQEQQVIDIWQDVNREMEGIISDHLKEFGNLYLMAGSGAKGNIAQIKQMAGMRGLMADPKGKILPLPIRSSFREGLSVLEYFISTHGARKGLADTALRTADSGYLTRRLVDVAQDVIAVNEDCGTMDGVWIDAESMDSLLGSLAEHIIGRLAAGPVAHPETGEIIVDRNEEIDEVKSAAIVEAGITRVFVRSPLACQTPRGMCAHCYGRSLARGHLVEAGEAIGIIAAQSIGEPGTQLTMRTFHTGGVAGVDITSGLPRVEEIFEARVPKLVAPIAEIDGVVEVIEDQNGRRVTVIDETTTSKDYTLPDGFEFMVERGARVEAEAVLASLIDAPAKPRKGTKAAAAAAAQAVADAEAGTPQPPALPPMKAEQGGEVSIRGKTLTIVHRDRDERTSAVSPNVRVLVSTGQQITKGTALAEGPLNPQDVLRIRGKDAVHRYLVDEVQRVYRSQGVVIHDKHIEIIVRQMLRRVRVDQPGDTEFLQGELVDRFLWQAVNAQIIASGGTPSSAQSILLGVTKVSLSTESFLAAASFQETTRVLTEAALFGKIDRLQGLKENVIIGRLIPARFGVDDEPGLLEAGGVATALAEPTDGYDDDDEAGLERIFNAAFGDDADDDFEIDIGDDEDDDDEDDGLVDAVEPDVEPPAAQ